MKLQIPLWLAVIATIICIIWFVLDLQKASPSPIPFEVPPLNKEIIMLITNRECFRIDGEKKILLFNLSTQEWNTLKKFRTPSTNGWLWITK